MSDKTKKDQPKAEPQAPSGSIPVSGEQVPVSSGTVPIATPSAPPKEIIKSLKEASKKDVFPLPTEAENE